MTRISQFDDVNAVLKKAESSLIVIEDGYKKSLRETKIGADLLVEIKDYLGNLRSALDYLRKKISNHNFPICDQEADFEKRSTDLPALVKNSIKKWQPFNDQKWMEWFNKLNNELKHVTPIPQKRTESVETRVSHPQGGGVSWTSGVTFHGNVSVMGVPINPRTQLPVPNNILKTEKITWVSFCFDNHNVPGLPSNLVVLPFLKECFEKIIKVVSDVEASIIAHQNQSGGA
ncbi:MAG: hypothetical protein Q7T03_09455 [Deltaproteobacteria bacterium]|nr:hypothetical protein [Deltaproteobacteria bacterium]